VEVRFEASGPYGEQTLGSLHQWLTGDRSLRGHARVERVTDGAVGRMGPGLEAVLAVVSTATAVAQLPLAYAAWRQGRRPQAPVTVNVVGGDPAEARALLERFGAVTPGTDAEARRQDAEDTPVPDEGTR
jgi:hypothetical protein